MLRVGWITFKMGLLAATLGFAACEAEEERPAPDPTPDDGRKVESTVRGEPVRQGFTQPPPHDAEWLPPSPPPFLTDAVPAAAYDSGVQSVLLALVASFEEEPSGELLSRLRETAREHARAGRLPYVSVPKLYEEYIYPSDIQAADEKYKGKLVVVTGRVAPENMTDPADGFKLFRQDPYVHEPLLLETPFETNFVRCHLARAEEQKLSDWETVHVLAVVEGKERGDLVLRRCVVLSERPDPA